MQQELPRVHQAWLDYLPAKADEIEALVTHRLFCTLVERCAGVAGGPSQH
jgi:hypothetical protein